MLTPVYTAENCRAAYQLNWSLAVFWNARPPNPEGWLPALREVTERDDVRVLEHLLDDNVSQFLLSTQPATRPPDIARSIKGRLQYLVREQMPQAFRRNYGLYSVGSAKRAGIEEYVRTQLGHHVMADSRVQERVTRHQIERPIDLGQPRSSGHAQFIYNLHVVLVNQNHLCDVRDNVLAARHDRVLAAGERKEHLLSRAAILTDHLHLTLGCGLNESPAEVALSYLNNLAHVEGMQPVYQYGYYVGTFGEYDLNAIRRRLKG
jgi:REP element-mobilizing transposase RayT